MQLPIVLVLAGLGSALPAPGSSTPTTPPASVTPEVNLVTGDKFNFTTINPDDAHKRSLETWNPEHIASSDNLLKYIEDNKGANHTIYLSDTRELIDLSTVELLPAKEGDNKRDVPDYCWKYKTNWAEQTATWWDAWVPLSECFYNEKSAGQATQTVTVTYSKTIETNTGISWTIIKDVLTVAAGVSVSQTWSQSVSKTCTIPAFSVGQLWGQKEIVWGWIWEQTCTRCRFSGGVRCVDRRALGGAKAPVSNHEARPGCSTGWGNVSCDVRPSHP